MQRPARVNERGASSWLRVAALLLAVAGAPGVASAQEKLALERFHPAPAGDRFFGLPSPYVAGEFDVHALLLVDYAYKPLLIHQPPADVSALVTYQAVVHANVSLAISRRALVNVDVPALSVQAGDTNRPQSRVAFGDIRLGGRARLYGENAAPLQLGLGAYLWVPSGTGTFTGDGKVRGMPYISLGGLSGALLWTAMAGAELRFQKEYEGVVRQGSSLNLGLGLGYLVDARRTLQIGAETSVSFVLSDPSSRNLNAELLFHGRYRFLRQFEAGVGVGPGLSEGVGTPTMRAVVLLAYVPVADSRPPPEPIAEGGEWPTGEGVFVRSDRRSDLEGLVPGVDGHDHRDHGAASRTEHDHRRRDARIVGDEIVASDGGILFEVGSAAIDARAERELHAIADLLILHPEIRKVEIRGHADLHGTLQSNAQLGARRAEAVKRALVRHSVEPARLAVKSYGPSAPAASSTTTEGLRRNRRVVIGILLKEPQRAE